MDIEYEINSYNDIDNFLIENFSDIQLKATNNQFDLKSNCIFQFSADAESKVTQAMYNILSSIDKV